jgi:hypothetical protein
MPWAVAGALFRVNFTPVPSLNVDPQLLTLALRRQTYFFLDGHK